MKQKQKMVSALLLIMAMCAWTPVQSPAEEQKNRTGTVSETEFESEYEMVSDEAETETEYETVSGEAETETAFPEEETEEEETDSIAETAVSGLKAESAGDGVLLSWEAAEGADGYLIGKRFKGEELGQIGYTSSTSWRDDKADESALSYYWVMPFRKTEKGGIECGKKPEKPVYGFKRLPAVENLTAEGAPGKVLLNWSACSGADGYRIGVKRGKSGKEEKIADTKGNSFEDTGAAEGEICYYRVIPYKKINGIKRAGVPCEPVSAAAQMVVTEAMKEALSQAETLLTHGIYSRKGLKEQLASEGFTERECTYAAETLDADWSEQAAMKAASYLRLHSFSRRNLLQQLLYDGFSPEESIAGANLTNTDWKAQAVLKAGALLSQRAYSREALALQLEEEGFTTAESSYAADAIQADWNEQAARKARAYLNLREFSARELAGQLIYDGFTQEQADYAVSAAGL